MDARKLVWNLSAEDGATGIIQGVNRETDKLKSNITGTSKSFKDMNKDLSDTGKSLIKSVTLPLAGIGAAGVGVVSSFDDSMSNIKAISGAVGKDFEDMRNLAKELGATTAHSASDAADGMGVLAASGMKTNEILGASKSMLDLMSAGAIDANTSASILTNTMAQFGVAATKEGTQYIADTFAKGAASAKLGVADLEYAMAQAGGAMASMNMNATGSVAAIGQLANAGMPIGQVGTALNAMTREIKANADEFKSVGINVYDKTTGDLKEMGQVMTELEKAVEGKTDAERDSILSTVFSGQAQKAATDWINQGSEAYEELAGTIFDADGAAGNMANTMEDNIGGAFRSLKSAGEGFLIEVGDVLKDDIRDLAGLATNLLGAFNGLDDETKTMIVQTAGLAVAIGPLMFGASKLMDVVTGIPGKLNVLKGSIGALTSPVALTIGAIGGLIAVGVHLYRTNEEARDKIDTAWEGIKNIVEIGVGFVQGLWSSHGENIMNIAGAAWEHISNTVMIGIDIITGVVSTISSIIDGDWAGAWKSAKGIVGNFISYLLGLPGQVFKIGKNIAKAAWDGIKSVGTGVKSFFTGKAGSPDSSNASGHNFIGKDGHLVKAHRREMVLTADTSDAYRSLGGTKNSLPTIQASNQGATEQVSYNPNYNINIEAGNKSTDELEIMIKNIIASDRELFFKKLNLQRG